MNIWGFLSAAVLLTLAPGPDILFVITQSITRGKRAGIVFVLGLCTGLIFHIAAVSLGVSILIKESPTAFMILKICGALYLIYLGVKTFLSRKQATLTIGQQNNVMPKLYRRGILMNLLNPKVILFFLAFIPLFINTDADNKALQLCFLGLLFIIQAFIIFTAVALLSSKLAGGLMGKPKVAYWINIAVSLIYAVIGISILYVMP